MFAKRLKTFLSILFLTTLLSFSGLFGQVKRVELDIAGYLCGF